MGKPQPRWWRGSSRSARTLGAFAVAVVLVVSLCFVGSRLTGARAALASSGPGRIVVAAAGAHHPGDGDRLATTADEQEELVHYMGGRRRRRLLSGGPGSHPPRCSSKCGSCNPCYPVHVSVPRGVLVTTDTEYYPEAWRCKCRNQLYMP